MMVLYAHLFAPQHDVDPGYAPSPFWWQFEAGQGAVLLFFVLSGYVIGLTNQGPISGRAAGQYLLRRFVRLVPLCWLAILLSVLARPDDTGATILGNVLFLQNQLPYGDWFFPLLTANTNLWSLNYEFLYYGLFIGIWLLPVSANRLVPAALTAVLLLGGVLVPGFPAFVSNYTVGWCFWLAGLWLSAAPKATAAHRYPWPALFLFALATWKVKPLFFLAKRFDLLPPTDGWINATFLDYLPVCVALVMIAAERRPRIAPLLVHLAAAVPVGFLAWRLLRGRFLADELAVHDGLVLAGIALWFWRPSLEIFRKLAPLGAISYGIYIFQRPAQWAVAYADWLPSGSVLTFALRAVIITLLTLGLAWLAERKLQPVIRRLFLPAPR